MPKAAATAAAPASTPPKRKPGHPEFEPTAEQRQLVLALTGYGIPQGDIAALIKNPHTQSGISEMTLRKWFAEEIKTGMSNANAKVVGALFKNATTTTPTYPGGIPVSQIFWLKCRAGWQRPEAEQPPLPQTPDERGKLEVVRRIAFALTIAHRKPKVRQIA